MTAKPAGHGSEPKRQPFIIWLLERLSREVGPFEDKETIRLAKLCLNAMAETERLRNEPAVDGPYASSADLAKELGASAEEAQKHHVRLESLAGARPAPTTAPAPEPAGGMPEEPDYYPREHGKRSADRYFVPRFRYQELWEYAKYIRAHDLALEARVRELEENGQRLMGAANGWKLEATALRGIEQALFNSEAKLREAEKDAKRWRWIELNWDYDRDENGTYPKFPFALTATSIPAMRDAIDAALAAQGGRKRRNENAA